MGKKLKNEIKEEQIKSLVNDLKSLPSIKIPSDFDDKLHNKIKFNNAKNESRSFLYSKYQKWLAYGFSICIVFCLSILILILINKQSPFNNLDNTFINNSKKVVITPPNNGAASSVSNTRIGAANNNNVSSEKKEEDFITQTDSNKSKTTDSDEQTTVGACERTNIDTLNNIDSLKRKPGFQKLNIKKFQN